MFRNRSFVLSSYTLKELELFKKQYANLEFILPAERSTGMNETLKLVHINNSTTNSIM